MKEEKLGLTKAEKAILERSADSQITRRRIRQVLFFASLLAVMLVFVGWALKSWQLLLGVALLYLLITTWEKVGYGNAVLLYKSLICKLSRRVEELEEETGR